MSKEDWPGKTGHVYQRLGSGDLYLCFHLPDVGQRLIKLDCSLMCNPLWSEKDLWGSVGRAGFYHCGRLKGVRL